MRLPSILGLAGRNYLPMLRDGPRLEAWTVDSLNMVLHEPGRDRIRIVHDDAVAGTPRDGRMAHVVELRREVGIAARGFLLACEDRRLGGDIVLGAVPGAETGDISLGLEPDPLEDLQLRSGMSERVLQSLLDQGEVPDDGRLGHEWPLAVSDIDQAHALLRLHRLAHGRAVDVEAGHRLALGREQIPRSEVALLEDGEQPVVHFGAELGTTDRFVGGRLSEPDLPHRGDGEGQGNPGSRHVRRQAPRAAGVS